MVRKYIATAGMAVQEKNGGGILYLLPDIVDGLVSSRKARVSVLKTEDTWFGVTYQEDKYAVREAFADLIRRGVYPEKL